MATTIQKIVSEFAKIREIKSHSKIHSCYVSHYFPRISTDFCLFESAWRFSVFYKNAFCAFTIFADAAELRKVILRTFPTANNGTAFTFRDLPRDLRADLTRFANLLHVSHIEFERKLAAIQARALAFPLVRDFLAEMYIDQILAGGSNFPVSFEEVMAALRAQIADELLELWDDADGKVIEIFNLKIDGCIVYTKIFSDAGFRYNYSSKETFADSRFIRNIDLNSPKLAIRIIRELRQERARILWE